MTTIQCHLYNHIPGTHHTWTLAVMSVSRRDADNYVKNHNGGGKWIMQALPGSKVEASCGATTEAAQAVIRAMNEREAE